MQPIVLVSDQDNYKWTTISCGTLQQSYRYSPCRLPTSSSRGRCRLTLHRRRTTPTGNNCLPFLPYLFRDRGSTRLVDVFLYAGNRNTNRFTGKRRMVVPLAQKVRIDQWRQERVLEKEGAKDHAKEDNDFSIGNNAHGTIIIICGPSAT